MKNYKFKKYKLKQIGGTPNNITIYIVAGANMILKLIEDNTDSWNNPEQCDIYVLKVFLQELHKLHKLNNIDMPQINIECFDTLYPSTKIYEGITFNNANFTIHNLDFKNNIIIVDFSNGTYNELFNINNEAGPSSRPNISDINLCIIETGCAYNQGFPNEIVQNVILNKLFYKPVKYNFRIPYEITQKINALKEFYPDLDMRLYNIGMCRLFGSVVHNLNYQNDLIDYYVNLQSIIREIYINTPDTRIINFLKLKFNLNIQGTNDKKDAYFIYNQILPIDRKTINNKIYGIDDLQSSC